MKICGYDAPILYSWGYFNKYCDINNINTNEITELDLENHKIHKWNNCPIFPKLKILNMSNNGITSLNNCPTFPNIEELNLNNNRITSLKGCPLFETLTEFNISNNPVSNWEGMPKFPLLKVLAIANTNITSWCGLPELANIDVLNIIFHNMSKSPLSMKCDKFPRLTHVYALDNVAHVKFMYGIWEPYYEKLLELSLIFHELPTYIICHIFDELGHIETEKNNFDSWRHADKIELISNVKKSIESLN